MNYPAKETPPVNSDLELLLELQVIDYDLGELERSKDYLPDMMENLQREVDDAKQKVVNTASALEEAKVTQKNLELEIQTREAELQKFQQQMMAIKTNKEYDALVAEIDNIKSAITTAYAELETVETTNKQLDKDIVECREKEISTVENNQKQLAVLQEKVDSIGDKVAAKREARHSVSSSISKPLISTYERVRKGRGGRAVVMVKKKACNSCFKALTPHRIQEIKRTDKVLVCEFCGCLLYWDPEESL